MRRLARQTNGSSMTASTGARGCQNAGAGRAADFAWLVVICTVTLPVPPAATVVLDGLNRHAAYAGSVPHCSEKVAAAGLGLTRLNRKLAVCPLETVWLPAPEVAAWKSNP